MVDAFFLKLQGDNRKNVLAVDPAEGKTGEKGCIFHRTVYYKEMVDALFFEIPKE